MRQRCFSKIKHSIVVILILFNNIARGNLKMTSSEKFCLKWNDFESNISFSFKELREEKDFFDVTLACEDDNQVMAHKVILSACSPFFRTILRRNSHQHPLIYLKGVKYRELLAVLNFMYQGEVSVAQDELNIFLTVAEDLRVKGLTQSKQPEDKNKTTDNIQPKSARVTHLTTPAPFTSKRSVQSAARCNQEHETEECIPVKVEPREPVSTQPEPAQFEDDQATREDHGTLALNEGYAVDEANDYQYTGDIYSDDAVGDAMKGDSNKGKKSKTLGGKKERPKVPIKSFGVGQKAWQCELCEKITSSRKKAFEHLEEDHQVSFVKTLT